MNYLMRNIPDQLWREFRSVCKSEKVTANKKIKRLIADYIMRSARKSLPDEVLQDIRTVRELTKL